MYEQYYGLREKPFSLTPDPAFLYLGRHHRRALLQLEYGLANEAAIVLVTGEVGTGKTTLIRYLLSRLDASQTVGLVSNTVRDSGQLLQWVGLAFGLDFRGKGDVELYDEFVAFLIEQYANGRRCLLIVDEAQNLGRKRLEELRLLTNVNVDKHFLLQIAIVGQPELRDLMRTPMLRQLVQRIGADHHISTLDEEETARYVRHRLRVAGGKVALFTNNSLKLVHASTGGVPRLINQLCDTALVYGFAEQMPRITSATMQEVINDRCAGGIFPGRKVHVRAAGE